jgi:hypothetical protein
MELAIFSVAILVAVGLAWLDVKCDIKDLNQKSNAYPFALARCHDDVVLVLSHVEEIKEVLTEASRLKAIRESGKEPVELRPSLRSKRFVGLAQRRAVAEAESIKSGAHAAVVHNNDVRAMEGR